MRNILQFVEEISRFSHPIINRISKDYRTGTYSFCDKKYDIEIEYNRDGKVLEDKFIDPTQCIGCTWLYNNDRSEGRPVPSRLVTSLTLPVETAPSVPAELLGDKFVCNDGNHRIYAAYLLEKDVKKMVIGKHKMLS